MKIVQVVFQGGIRAMPGQRGLDPLHHRVRGGQVSLLDGQVQLLQGFTQAIVFETRWLAHLRRGGCRFARCLGVQCPPACLQCLAQARVLGFG